MSTAVATAAPPPQTGLASSLDRHVSPRQFAPIAPSTASAASNTITSSPGLSNTAQQQQHHSATNTDEPAQKRARSNGSPTSAERPTTAEKSLSNGKRSPNSIRSGGFTPMIKVKKEPGSPSMPTSKRRPNKLDLSASSGENRVPHTARPSTGALTSQQSAGLAIQDVGLACLSPGFQTNDPGMREQLQRSLDVRDQQRMIIEARQKGKTGSSGESTAERPQDNTIFGVPAPARAPMTSRRKGPPPGLAISAPAASQFANERVIQSAPLHQTFTGLHRHPPGPSALSQTSHIHHVPAQQTNNRLPPISDVFANPWPEDSRSYNSPGHSGQPPVPSPSFPPPSHQHNLPPPPLSARTREFRSAEEAVHSMSGGRDELMPKVVHYGGVQPPTPPSPMPPGGHQHSAPAAAHAPGPHHHQDPTSRPTDILHRTASMNGRRRGRDEYERDNGSPPLPHHYHSSQHHDSDRDRDPHKRTAYAPFNSGGFRPDSRSDDNDWRSTMSGAEKKEEFLRLCERAWDLFHS